MIQIPKTIDAATKALEGIGALLRAKEWERAAIVYAFTYDTGGGRPTQSGEKSPLLTIDGFANLNLRGLATRNSVRVYRKNWLWAIDNGYAMDINPGDKAEPPDVKWPGIESRPNKHRVKEMDRSKLAEGIAARDDVDSVIESVAEHGKMQEVITGTGKAAVKATRRQAKETEAADDGGKPAATKKTHTPRGSAEFLMRAHAARTEWQAVAEYLEEHRDLELTDEEQAHLKTVHDEMVAISAAVYLAITGDLVGELEK